MAITQRKQNVGISPNANIETYENPIQRAEERQHLHTLRSLPYAALASILVNNVYFAYRAYCLLKCQSSGTLAGWIMLGVEVGLTSKHLSEILCSTADTRQSLPWVLEIACALGHGPAKDSTATSSLGR